MRGGGREQSGKLIRLALCSSQPAWRPKQSHTFRGWVKNLSAYTLWSAADLKHKIPAHHTYIVYIVYIHIYVCVYSSIFAVEIPRLDSHCLHSCTIDLFTIQSIYAACRAWDSGTSLPALTTVTLPATAQRFLLKLSLSWVITRVFHTLCLSVSRTRCILYCCRRCLSHTLSVFSPRPVAWHRPRLICLLFCYETKLCQGQIYMNTLSAGDVCLCSCCSALLTLSALCKYALGALFHAVCHANTRERAGEQ